MLRIALATYLMVATVAAPCLCCCQAARLRTLLAPAAPATSPCCCEHGEKPRQERCPEVPHPGRPNCPCQDCPARTGIALPPTSETARQSAAQPFEGPADIPPARAIDTALPIGLSSCTSEDRPVLPFLTADDILHILHILRC
jgi:hypothetical protein